MSSGKYQVVIISDCRFPDEINYFKELETTREIYGVISARIFRPNRKQLTGNNQNHQSEFYILNLTVQYEIINNGSIDELHKKLENTVLKQILSIQVNR